MFAMAEFCNLLKNIRGRRRRRRRRRRMMMMMIKQTGISSGKNNLTNQCFMEFNKSRNAQVQN
jgi:hypothetical protein